MVSLYTSFREKLCLEPRSKRSPLTLLVKVCIRCRCPRTFADNWKQKDYSDLLVLVAAIGDKVNVPL